ncbi:helix-turn-helix transcriptional regulator [Mesorhizobium argentiipisi]|uniref:Helix-turn-helix transcriptional regulator n=1 Tax=Mesorhizobium argentiipisi TaxID=3015175 RepID=A0ABU8KCX7_9HYPH
MDLRDVLAANLRRLRHAKGLSQDDLAYEANVSRSYLSQIEKGKYYASLGSSSSLQKCFKSRLRNFLGLQPSMGRVSRHL